MAKKASKKLVPKSPAPPAAGIPTTASEWIIEAEKAERLHNLVKARDYYCNAIKVDPQNIHAWFKKGLLLESMANNSSVYRAQQDLYLDAIQSFERVTAIAPQHIKAFVQVGQVFVRLAEHARVQSEAKAYVRKAFPPLNKALELDPMQSQAWFARALAHLHLKQVPEALQDFIKTTEKDNQNVTAWWNLACLHESQGRFQPAVDAFEKVLALSPYYPEVDVRLLELRTELHARSRTPDIAVRDREALNLIVTGRKLVKQDNYPKAIQFLSLALRTFDAIDNLPGQIESVRYIALSYKALCQWDTASSFFMRLRTLANQAGDVPKIAEAGYNLGYVAFRGDQLEDAITYLSESVSLYRRVQHNPNLSDGLSVLGKIYQLKGDLPRAIECYTECLHVDFARNDLYRQGQDLGELGDIFKMIGDLESARKNYTKAIEIYKALNYQWKVEEVTEKLKAIGGLQPQTKHQGKRD